jgi:hypothetical protein
MPTPDADAELQALKNPKRSVLQDWVMELPLREQGTLLTAVRGCDLTPKYPLDSPERQLVACIRGAFMVPADEREVDKENGSFMSRRIPTGVKFSAIGHYPQHWVSHVLHAVEVLAYRTPSAFDRRLWFMIYARFCHALHVGVETRDEFVSRMSVDRIADERVVE